MDSDLAKGEPMTLFSILIMTLVAFPMPVPEVESAEFCRGVEETVPVVTFVQEVTGRPGSPDSNTVIQQVVLATDKAWLEDSNRGLIQILRGDRTPPVLWEVSGDLQRYREVTDLARIQKDRRIQEMQFLRRVADLPAEERRQMLNGAHIRLNDEGQPIREISLEEVASAESSADGLRQVKVYENGRLVADLKLSDLEIPFSLAPLHEATGAFSREAFEVIRDLKGFPVSGTIYVVTATLTHPLNFRIRDIERSKFPVAFFDLPKGCQKEEQRSFLNCPICGSEVERESSAARARDREGRWIFFDSRECFSEWKKQRKTRQ